MPGSANTIRAGPPFVKPFAHDGQLVRGLRRGGQGPLWRTVS